MKPWFKSTQICSYISWWRAFYSHGHEILSTQQHQSQSPLLFLVVPLSLLGTAPPKLVSVSKDKVHVFVEGFECADERAPVLERAPHSVVDVLDHLTAACSGLKSLN